VFLVGCGMDFKVKLPKEGPETKVTLGPDLEAAGQFCANRYPEDAIAEEQCFQDYLDYYKLKVELDLESITEFCNQYEQEADRLQCQQDLIDILGNAAGGEDESGQE